MVRLAGAHSEARLMSASRRPMHHNYGMLQLNNAINFIAAIAVQSVAVALRGAWRQCRSSDTLLCARSTRTRSIRIPRYASLSQRRRCRRRQVLFLSSVESAVFIFYARVRDAFLWIHCRRQIKSNR